MKCIECQVNETEENSALCVHCDREEWQDACRRGNARFQYAERQLSKLHSEIWKYLADNKLATEYPANSLDMITLLKELNAK